MKEWLERVKKENEELQEKINRLNATVCNPPSYISSKQIILMRNQLRIMQLYREILLERIKLGELE